MKPWHLMYGSQSDFEADVTVEERNWLTQEDQRVKDAPKRQREKLEAVQPAARPIRPEAPDAQLGAARDAALLILSRNVVPDEVTIRLAGYDGPENQTDSVSVTISQR